MNLDRPQQIYGRKDDLANLQRVFHAILKSSDNECNKQFPYSSATVVSSSTSPTTSTSFTGDDGVCFCSASSEVNDYNLHKNCHLILISGPDGSGKRTLAREALNKCRNTRRCCHIPPFVLASGQFRIYKGNLDEGSPYSSGQSREFDSSFSAFRDAMREMIDILMPDGEIIHAILENLRLLLKDPKDSIALIEAFPCVKQLLQLEPTFQMDDRPEVYSRVSLYGIPSRTERFQALCRTVKSFLRAVSSCIPLVFVLEDLQYADEQSLYLIESLMDIDREDPATKSINPSQGLLMVTTYATDGGEAIPDALISIFRQDVDNEIKMLRPPVGLYQNSKHHYIHHVCLSNLTWYDALEWTQNCYGTVSLCSLDQKRDVTDLVFQYTLGSPYRIHYLFQFLQHNKTPLDPSRKASLPNSVAELYTSILLRRDDPVLNLVRCTATLAQQSETDAVDCEILRIAMEKPCVDEVLQAHECGLLEFFPSRGYVRFCRKELLDAAYSSVPDPSMLHVAIGRSLWREAMLMHDQGNTNEAEMKRMVLRAILHLRRGIDLCDVDEKIHISQLCYEYGEAASRLGDFAASAKFFAFAIDVLGPYLWRNDMYETSLALHNSAAQAYFYICDVEKTEQTLDEIFSYARCLKDKIPAYFILVYARAKHQMKDACRIVSFVSGELGEGFNTKPGTFILMKNLLRMKCSLRGKSDELLRNLPDACDDDLVIAHFLSFAMFFIFIVQPETSFLLCSRLIYLSVSNGITGPAAVAFAQYGNTLCAWGKLEEGYRFGQLAVKFADRFEVWRPRIYMFVYGFTNLWTHPFRDAYEPLCCAQRDAIKFGDLQAYGAVATFLIPILLFSGAPLTALQVDARSICQSLADVGQTNPLLFLVIIWNVINKLTGNQEALIIGSDIRTADAVLKYAVKEDVVIVLGHFYADQAMLYYLLGDSQKSLEMVKKANEHFASAKFNVTFYEGLATSALAWEMKSRGRRRHINHCRKLARLMGTWACRCPENFRNKQLLMDAEIAALAGKSSLAFALYKESASTAKRENFLHEEGMAYERCGLYELYLGDTSGAHLSLKKARMTFEKWGAGAVVERMNKLIVSIKP